MTKCKFLMPLDPKAKALLTAIIAAGDSPLGILPVEIARQQIDSRFSQMRIPLSPVGSTRNIPIPGPGGDIPLRIYTPSGNGPFPLVVYFHGGGWVLFGLDSYDSICTHLCKEAHCIVVSVAYRLAPENKFPAAVDDCLSATEWVFKNAASLHGDPARVVVAGDSAGGNLAAVTALQLKDKNGPELAGQVMIYPATDYYWPEKRSYRELGDDYILTRKEMIWFWSQYLADPADAVNPYVAPLKVSSCKGLPPALILVSAYDLLLDEGIAYGEKLRNDGVPVKISVYKDMMHGFLSYLGILKQAKTAIEEISSWIIKTVN